MYTHTHTHTHTDRMWSVGLGLAAGLGVVMGVIKFRHGTYLPELQRQTAANIHTHDSK